MGDAKKAVCFRVQFNRRIKLDFHGPKVTRCRFVILQGIRWSFWTDDDRKRKCREWAHGQLHAPVDPFPKFEALDAEHFAGETHKNRRKINPPWQVYHFPDGRGGHSKRNVQKHAEASRAIAIRSRYGMTKRIFRYKRNQSLWKPPTEVNIFPWFDREKGKSAIIVKYCRFDHQITKEEIAKSYWKQKICPKY